MVVEHSPEDLPRGWTLHFSILKTGRKIKYYVNSGTGQKYSSKDDIMRHFKESTQLDHPQESKNLMGTPSKIQQVHHVEYANELPEWLPHGWIMELKTRKSGNTSGRVYKCYVDPSTQCKFYSKPEVFRYLKNMKHINQKTKQEKIKSVLPTNEPSSAAKRQKEHPANEKLLLTGKDSSGVDCMVSSEADSLSQSGVTSVTSVNTLPLVSTVDRPSNKSPKDNVSPKDNLTDNNVEYMENSNSNCSAPTKPEVSTRSSDTKACIGDGYGLLTPEVNNKQGRSLESGIKRDESYKRKTENGLSKSCNKKWLSLPRRSSRRLAGIEPEPLDHLPLVQVNPEADNKQEENYSESGIKEDENQKNKQQENYSESAMRRDESQKNKQQVNYSESAMKGDESQKNQQQDNYSESAMKGDESHKGITLHNLSKPVNKRGLLPCRSSKRLAGIEQELADSVSIVQALPTRMKSPKDETIQAVVLNSDVLSDKKCEHVQIEPVNQIVDHTSSTADNSLLVDTSNQNEKIATTCSVSLEADVFRRNECNMVSADDKPVLSLEADVRNEESSLERQKKGKDRQKTQNVLNKFSHKKGINLPQRSSKRLAGLEPELAVNSESSEQALQNAKRRCAIESIKAVGSNSDGLANIASQPHNAEARSDFSNCALIDFSNSLQGPSDKNQVSLHEQVLSMDKSQLLKTEENKNVMLETQFNSTFGEFLSDPCLEFAFKTLTGEIPVEIAADTAQVSTPAIDTTNKRNFTLTKTDTSGSRKMQINSGCKRSKKLHLPQQSPGQLVGPECEATASSISSQHVFKIKDGKPSETNAVPLYMDMTPDNLAVGAQQLNSEPKAGHMHYRSANVASLLQNEPSSKKLEPLNVTANQEHTQKFEAERNVSKQEQQPVFAFGDYWSDPCFEFAFKTLTGAIPVEDNLPVQNYFQQQLDTSQTQRDSYLPQQVDASQTLRDGGLALPDYGLPGFFQTDISVHFDAPEKQRPSQQPQVPLNNTTFMPSGNVALPTCSSIGSQQPQSMKKNKGLYGKVHVTS